MVDYALKCPYTSNNTADSASYKPANADNPVLVILQEPGIAEVELGRPATGRTGANICRLFKMMKRYGCGCTTAKNVHCYYNVSVINAKTENGRLIYQDSKYLNSLSELKNKRVVYCFGEKAVRCFKALYRKRYLHRCNKLFCFPHIGTKGLSYINVSGIEAEEKRETAILRRMSYFIEKHLGEKANCFLSVQEFLKESNVEWRKGTLQDWARKEWVQKIMSLRSF